MTNSNLEKGIPWRFGPDWPGQRCGAKTRKGTPCQRPAYKRNGRCSLHGGKSTGPKTEDGLARLTAARTTHGKYTKEKRAVARRYAEQGGQSLLRLRNGSWTTGTWTKNGGIGSNKGWVIAAGV